ncbi:hypothetical protein MHM582_2142 [Microbacterium sp. HM58-2]|nr:hypothetical protein MHM582_2142 [Microbacterium sp. HM58-2]
MRQALRTFGRILARHWPALMAWYLGGEALHQALVQLAGFVGGHTTLGGLLLLPLAVAARLVSYVAMYLTVRPSMPHAAERTRPGIEGFVRSTLVAILPFFAFYAAWGMLDRDQKEFFIIASAVAFRESGFTDLGDRGGLISVGLLPVFVLVVALLGRLLLARFRERLPEWTLAFAVYLEALWTFMLFTLVAQWWADVREWLAGRAFASWLDEFGDGVAASIPAIATIWEAILWLVGIVVAAVIVPAAWLAVAGIIYGADFATLPPLLQRMEARRGATGTLSRTLLRQLEDVGAALAAIWRGGPLLFGIFAAAYALWALAERAGTRGLLEAIGGQDGDFWSAFFPLILVAVAVIAEPLRVAVVATAFDAVVGRPAAGINVRASGLHPEPGLFVAGGDVEPEGAVGVLREQEHREDAVGG